MYIVINNFECLFQQCTMSAGSSVTSNISKYVLFDDTYMMQLDNARKDNLQIECYWEMVVNSVYWHHQPWSQLAMKINHEVTAAIKFRA